MVTYLQIIVRVYVNPNIRLYFNNIIIVLNVNIKQATCPAQRVGNIGPCLGRLLTFLYYR